MLPCYSLAYANPSSVHKAGKAVKKLVETAREQVASLIDADMDEIIFTSGATEALNLAIKGYHSLHPDQVIYTNKAEHKAVLDVCENLARQGAEVHYLPVDELGRVDFSLSHHSVGLLVQMLVNNETGVINLPPSERTGAILIDATQHVGKLPLSVTNLNVDFAAFSSHKIYGPKGIGALYIKRGSKLTAQIHGGGHENGLRSGTLNVPGIVGFGAACAIVKDELEAESARILRLKQELEKSLLAITGAVLNGDQAKRVSNTLNISFSGIEGTLLVGMMGEIAISSGSACTSALVEPSHVLLAMGLNVERAYCAIRFSLGRFTKSTDIAATIKRVTEILDAHRH
jgi:cysteine desulfurase